MADFTQNMIEKVLENIDGNNTRLVMIPVMSERDGKTFEYYWKMISSPNDNILLVHIVKPQDATKEKWGNEMALISTITKPFEHQCKEHSVSYQVILHIGTPGEGIVDLVKEHKPDILVVGSTGLSEIRQHHNTSVSEYVYHHAKVPVLIVGHDWKKYVPIGKEELDDEEDEVQTLV